MGMGRPEIETDEQVKAAVAVLDALTDLQRYRIFHEYFCRDCGGDDPGCQCWNDD